MRTGELCEVCRQGNDSARLGFVLNDACDSNRRFLGYCRREVMRAGHADDEKNEDKRDGYVRLKMTTS